MKILQAKLKNEYVVSVNMEGCFDFVEDFINASTVVQEAKRKLFNQLKTSLHEKIATLNIDDLEFKIIKN